METQPFLRLPQLELPNFELPKWAQQKRNIVRRMPRTYAVGVVAAVCIILFIALLGPSIDSTKEAFDDFGASPLLGSSDRPFGDIIVDLFQTERIPIAQRLFIDTDGQTYSLPSPSKPLYTKSFGKKALILDIDTRALDQEGELFSPHDWHWPEVDHLSAGFLTHYLYAKIHGYDYLNLRAPVYKDRHGAWGKVLMMQHALENHEVIVFLDSDAILTFPELPLEWLMNYWNINETVSVAISGEPEREKDMHGNIATNTGFLIVRNNAKSHQLFKAWAECPGETRYPGCGHWKQDRVREQGAFSDYIRWDPEFNPWIQVLPCTETNGYPKQYEACKCRGVFVRHHWMDKYLTKDMFADNAMRVWAKRMHRWYLERGTVKDGFIQDLTNKTLVGSEVVEGGM